MNPERGGPQPLSQRLLFPAVLSLTPAEAEMAQQAADALTALGYSARSGAGGSLVIDAVPALLHGRLDERALASVLSELADPALTSGEALRLLKETEEADPAGVAGARGTAPGSSTYKDRIKYLAATFACKSAVKAGDSLTPAQRESLVAQVLEREYALSCPHGRPTVIRLGKDELAGMFLR
jgi:DNA mismatch repair protein MutL